MKYTLNLGYLDTEAKVTKVFGESALGRLLAGIMENNAGTQLVDTYLNDFVQMVYRAHSKSPQIEYKVKRFLLYSLATIM